MSEYEEQRALIEWCEWNTKAYPGIEMIFHIPNGEWRVPRTASKLKKMGVKPGIPDLFLAVPRGQYHGLFIEVKTKTGKVTENQERWHNSLRAKGYCVEVCKGWEVGARVLINYLG